MKNKKSFWASLFEGLFSNEAKKYFVGWLKKQSIKAVLKKLVISGGIKGWLISFVVGELIDEADQHLIEPAFRKIGFYRDSLKGKAVYKRMEDAENRDDWRDTVRDS